MSSDECSSEISHSLWALPLSVDSANSDRVTFVNSSPPQRQSSVPIGCSGPSVLTLQVYTAPHWSQVQNIRCCSFSPPIPSGFRKRLQKCSFKQAGKTRQTIDIPGPRPKRRRYVPSGPSSAQLSSWISSESDRSGGSSWLILENSVEPQRQPVRFPIGWIVPSEQTIEAYTDPQSSQIPITRCWSSLCVILTKLGYPYQKYSFTTAGITRERDISTDTNREGMRCPECDETHANWTKDGEHAVDSGSHQGIIECGGCGLCGTIVEGGRR